MPLTRRTLFGTDAIGLTGLSAAKADTPPKQQPPELFGTVKDGKVTATTGI